MGRLHIKGNSIMIIQLFEQEFRIYLNVEIKKYEVSPFGEI